MRKIKLMSLLSLSLILISGCSCSNVDENTYTSAVNSYKNTDAIYFSRVEVITEENATTYVRKQIDAKYVYDASGKVTNMQYALTYSDASTGGGISVSKVVKYYYSDARNTLYTYSKIGQTQLETYKESNVSYNDKFNINVCQNSDCMLMITSNLIPLYNLNEVENFSITNKGVATFRAVCPNFENCASNSQMIDYTLTINSDGNIDALTYEIVNGSSTYQIKYSFFALGSNNVVVEYPSDLESYGEK